MLLIVSSASVVCAVPSTASPWDAVSDETDFAAGEVGMEGGVQLAPQNMQRAHDMLCLVVGRDVLPDIGGKPVKIGIDGDRILPPRVLDGQVFDVERAERWRVAGKLEHADRVLVEVVLPFLDDLIRRHAELRLVLRSLNFVGGEGSCVLVRDGGEADGLAGFVRQVDAGRLASRRALGGVVRRPSVPRRPLLTASASPLSMPIRTLAAG
jgi:hypothetical protein